MRLHQDSQHIGGARSGFYVVALVICVLLGTLVRGPGIVYAAENRPVVSHSATSVLQGETAHDVVVLGHDVRVAGVVTDNLVVIHGNIYLAPTAHVDTLIDIGGQVHRENGAHVTSILVLTFNHALLNSTVVGGAMLAFLTALRLTFSAVIVVLPILVAVVLKPWIQTPTLYLQKSMRQMGGVGILATIGMLAVSAGFSVTVIGIPIAAVICVVYLCVGLIGLASVSLFIGKSLVDAFHKRYHTWLQSLIGATLVMAFSNIPLLGLLIVACVWIVGVGTATTWLWRLIQLWRKKSGRQRA